MSTPSPVVTTEEKPMPRPAAQSTTAAAMELDWDTRASLPGAVLAPRPLASSPCSGT